MVDTVETVIIVVVIIQEVIVVVVKVIANATEDIVVHDKSCLDGDDYCLIFAAVKLIVITV